MPNRVRPRQVVSIVAVAMAALVLAGCAPATASPSPSGTGSPATQLRLGLFANVTHGPALIGLKEGYFQKELGSTQLSTQVFNAGPTAIEALNADAIDATYIGPSPAINAFIKSRGKAGLIVAGAASGGAQLVVRDGINTAADLRGKTLATPQLGNTQDVALRTYLKSQGYTTDTQGGGDVKVTPTDNAQALQLFQAGKIDGAWLPEPWSSRFVLDGGGHVLVDEASLWPDGRFATTVLMVSATYAQAHPQTVAALVRANAEAVAITVSNPEQAASDINAELTALSGKGLSPAVLARAVKNVTFTNDPDASTFAALRDHAAVLGLASSGNLSGLFQLATLNEQLAAAGKPTVSAAGLGSQ